MSSIPDFPIELADRCVMCGLCIPHCPTYGLARSENESPRGRISLILGLARGQLEPNGPMLAHLDHCLECRACEAVCPSRVPYGRLMDETRGRLRSRRRQSWSSRRMLALLGGSPARLGRWARALYLYQRLGLNKLLAGLAYLGSGQLRRLHRLLPTVGKPGPAITLYPADVHVPTRGKVQLFSGCATRLFDHETRAAAIFLLNRLGYVVQQPERQVCCGALHRHEGRAGKARELAQQNIHAFNDPDNTPILSLASGCTSHLSEYPLTAEDWRAEGFSQRVEDITAFLARARWPEHYRFEPLPVKVAVHEPCLQRNVLKQSFHNYALLQKIPGLQTVPLPGNEVCCGAAGSHMLSQPSQADALLAPKLEAATRLEARILVSANIGCALHLAAGLRERGEEIEVVHPLTLLARQLRTQ